MKSNIKFFFFGLLYAAFTNSSIYSQVSFIDYTKESGIDHHHQGWMYGGGAASGDFDNDGYLDLFIADGLGFPNLLYLNNQDGSFREVGFNAGVADTLEGLGVVAGDIDNDGDLDIYVANYFQENKLYLNNGDATFIDATYGSGLDDSGPSNSVAFVDYDNDGWLDVFVVNRSQLFDDYSDKLYKNNGNGKFIDVTESAHVGFMGISLGVGFFDLDNDRDQDIYIADEFARDALYVNNGDGTFTDRSQTFTFAPGGGMGIDFADYNHDGFLDIYVGNFAEDFLLQNNKDGTFSEVAIQSGINNTAIAWGINFFDCDNDGDRDLYVVNGQMIMVWDYKYGPNRFYLNNGNGTFTEKASQLAIAETGDGRGSVTADFNNDGYLDIFIINVNKGKSVLYLNPGGKNHWITLQLEGTKSNRSAIGTRVEVIANGRKQIDEVRAGSSYASMHSLDLEFGLSRATLIDTINVYWPSGINQQFTNVNVNQIFKIIEPSEITFVDQDQVSVLPTKFELYQNYPNPFNGETQIRFDLETESDISLQIFNMLGQQVYQVQMNSILAGKHSFVWNGIDQTGSNVPAGIYLFRIILNSNEKVIQSTTQKMILAR